MEKAKESIPVTAKNKFHVSEKEKATQGTSREQEKG